MERNRDCNTVLSSIKYTSTLLFIFCNRQYSCLFFFSNYILRLSSLHSLTQSGEHTGLAG